jgi:hypothetical protein
LKLLLSILPLILFLTACTPGIGAGIGVAGISNDSGGSAVGTEIIADSETGIHGSVAMGTDINM